MAPFLTHSVQQWFDRNFVNRSRIDMVKMAPFLTHSVEQWFDRNFVNRSRIDMVKMAPFLTHSVQQLFDSKSRTKNSLTHFAYLFPNFGRSSKSTKFGLDFRLQSLLRRCGFEMKRHNRNLVRSADDCPIRPSQPFFARPSPNFYKGEVKIWHRCWTYKNSGFKTKQQRGNIKQIWLAPMMILYITFLEFSVVRFIYF